MTRSCAGMLGQWGESLACGFLRRKGMEIIDRNFRAGRFELDIVARDGDELVFVEVKVRRRADRGGPMEAVGFKKQRDLTRAAALYMLRRGVGERPCRFDVVAILLDDKAGKAALRHIENAFQGSRDLRLYL